MSRFEPRISAAGVGFRLWAPAAGRVDRQLETPVADRPAGERLALAARGAATRYRFRIDGELDAPDFYQGTELRDPALVDPDNRRPVDFVARRALLDEAAADIDAAQLARSTAACRHDGCSLS